jgi:hypothetical protein
VYSVPFVSPEKMATPPDPVFVIGGFGMAIPPGSVTFTVYPTIGNPPLLLGEDHVIVKVPELDTAARFKGIDGGLTGIPFIAEGDDIPRLFTAETNSVYVRPSISPVNVYDVAVIPGTVAPPSDTV